MRRLRDVIVEESISSAAGFCRPYRSGAAMTSLSCAPRRLRCVQPHQPFVWRTCATPVVVLCMSVQVTATLSSHRCALPAAEVSKVAVSSQQRNNENRRHRRRADRQRLFFSRSSLSFRCLLPIVRGLHTHGPCSGQVCS